MKANLFQNLKISKKAQEESPAVRALLEKATKYL